MIYYVSGNFGSRLAVEVGSITLHPSGLPHGPRAGGEVDRDAPWYENAQDDGGEAAVDADATGAGLTSHL